MLAIQNPLPVFHDTDGLPLDGGYLYFGAVNQNPETAPVVVYWDAAGTQPVAQPARTVNGYVVRNGAAATVYAGATYSMTSRNVKRELVGYWPSSANFDNAAAVDATLTNLIASLPSSSGPTVGIGGIGYSPTVAYTSGPGRELRQGINLATWPGVDATGAAECGAAIRLAMAESASSGRPLIWNAGTYLVAADPASPLAAGFRTYCLKPANNARWVIESGATIKAANGLESWCRVVSFQGVSGLRVFGELRVDANVQNIGATNNEHMHGVFFFDTVDFYVEAIHSVNARADNVFIGGTDETTYGKNGYIGRIFGRAAGRKNLTLHYCDGLTIGAAELDNSTGGAGLYGGVADTTDKHCLDVEPDAYTGATRFTQSIGTLNTYGLGNDFTAGTTPAHRDGWTLNIGAATCVQSASSGTVPAWEQNAITINCGNLKILDCAGMDLAVKLAYAAALNVGGELTISGASATAAGFLAQAAASGGDENKPIINVGKMVVRNTVGAGIDLRSSVTDIVTMDAQTVGYAMQAGDSVTDDSYRGGVTIGHLISRDTGTPTTGAVVNCETFALTAHPVTIRKMTLLDTRATKVGSAVRCASGASGGLVLGELVNPENIPAVAWGGTDAYYRLAGGPFGATPRSPGMYVVFGTPEGFVPAAVGSMAMRTDGGAGTSLYVKQAGTGSNGWVGK